MSNGDKSTRPDQPPKTNGHTRPPKGFYETKSSAQRKQSEICQNYSLNITCRRKDNRRSFTLCLVGQQREAHFLDEFRVPRRTQGSCARQTFGGGAHEEMTAPDAYARCNGY